MKSPNCSPGAASNEEIAQALWISRHTLKDHTPAVQAKLDVGGRAGLSAKLFHERIAALPGGQRIREFPSSKAAS